MPSYKEELEELMQSFVQSNPAVLHCALLSSNGDIIVSIVSQQEDIYYNQDTIAPSFQNFVKNIRTRLHVDFLNQIILDSEDYKIHFIQTNPVSFDSILVLVEYTNLFFSLGSIFAFIKKIGRILEQLKNEKEIIKKDNPFALKKLINKRYIPEVLFLTIFSSKDIQIYEILPGLDKKKIYDFAKAIQETTAEII